MSPARNWTFGSFEAGLANSTWMLSAMTASVHQAFGLAGAGSEGAPLLWSVLMRPVWLIVSVLLAPVLWAIEVRGPQPQANPTSTRLGG